jgi:hypothetical protein
LGSFVVRIQAHNNWPPTLQMPDKLTAYTTDQGLIAGLQSGDPSAFDALYHKFAPLILTQLENIQFNEERYEEVLLTIFLRIKGEINSFDSSNMRLFTWILTLAKEVINQHCAKEINAFQIQQQKKYVENKNSPLLNFVMTSPGNYEEMANMMGITKMELAVIIKNEIKQIK